MAQGSVTQTVAAQKERMSSEMPVLFQMSAPLFKRIKASTTVHPVSTRPERVPFEALPGGKLRVANYDGGALGRGSGPTLIYGNISSISYVHASEYTALSRFSTDSDDKAIKDYVALTESQAVETFGQQLDALIALGDGANTIDVITGTVTGGLLVRNANKFLENQDVDIWTAVGGTFVGSVTVLTRDVATNTVWLTGSVPGGTTAGYVCLVSGSAGVANTGIYGLQYYNTPGNAGNYLGIQRSSYPGLFNVPTANLAGAALTPAAVRALEGNIRLAIGSDKAAEANLIAHCGVEMQSAWENNTLLVQHVELTTNNRDQAVNMLAKNPPTMMGKYQLVPNERATPGRIDFIALDNWERIEVTPLADYEVDGQTLFPAYGSDGGLVASMMFYKKWIGNILNRVPRSGAAMTNIAIPSGFFGVA
jgi:hypothetical protein